VPPERSTYTFTVRPAKGHHWPVVLIVDHDQGRSVTNDVQGIFADLVAQGLDLEAHRVIYRDTLGTWDELLVGVNGSFGGFAPLGAHTEAEAIAKLEARWNEDREHFRWLAENAEPERPLPEPSHAEIVAMTIRHGSDYVKRYFDGHVAEGHPWEDDAERLRVFASDLGGDPQAEILPFTPREPQP
jgi:hypothetical protein